ncbi:cleavage and polyadenylation specificity factor subunit 7-like [Heptranchias perlo]|uniref:cleavage and polyadenylation specificity factor subunit 7-like n=1 Tax=Heptranchias perlo TaxID=212740 RepID=UPI0035597336
MAVHSNMAGESVHGLLDVDSAEGDSSEQLENENQGQMDLYDDLINDIIGVPLNNGLNPEKDNYDLLPKSSSNNIIVPTTAGPIKAAPSKRFVPDKIDAPLPEEKILLIGNLTWWTTGDDLVAAIRSAGIFNVDKIKFYEVPKGGQSKGFVRVNLSSDWDINRLLEMLPKKEVHGRSPDVRHFTTANRQYFETQFINAMEKSKLHSAKHDIFDDHPVGSDDQSASDPSKGANQEPISRQIQHNSSAPFKNLNSRTMDSTLQDKTSSPFQKPPVKLATSAVETKLQQGSTPSPKFLLQDLISLAVPPTNIPGPALSGHRQSQTLQTACVDPVTFMTPTNTSLSTLDSNKTPSVYNTCYKDYRIPGRETGFQETLQSKKELIKELDRKGTFSTNDDGSKDDCSEDYGTLLRLVSFVKKSKAIAQDNYRDSLNCPPNQLHGGEAKPYSSGLREHEYPRQRENQRSGERSGSLRDRSRSPSSCDGHYQEKKMDYDQERQQSHQRIHFENSPRIDHHHPDRSRDQRDSFGQERPCDSMRYLSRNSDTWNIYSEKSGKGQDYSPEKYCGIKQEKDREYRF